ncbi:unnamed protein product [Prorocentrum cordatum]|uniref:Uncharacterized protein n=1 Tax=Prorocentrum cordatum TaxID=2364126 RepID=A0ABN9V5N0_9DINO|nr:unnamed protein product [Polarella glacialis]
MGGGRGATCARPAQPPHSRLLASLWRWRACALRLARARSVRGHVRPLVWLAAGCSALALLRGVILRVLAAVASALTSLLGLVRRGARPRELAGHAVRGLRAEVQQGGPRREPPPACAGSPPRTAGACTAGLERCGGKVCGPRSEAERPREAGGPQRRQPHAEAPPRSGRPRLGDIVRLGPGSPREFHQRLAVVTGLAEAHCTVVVLDPSRRYGVGECWPGFDDVVAVSSALRVGERVTIAGLRGAKTRHLNGLTGTIRPHPRSGHPTFVHKASSPDQPQLAVCVGLDDPERAGDSSVLLESRFLQPREECLAIAAQDLDDVLASMSTVAKLASPGKSLASLMDSYLGEPLRGSIASGPALCVIACLCWHASAMREVRSALALSRGLLALPRGETTWQLTQEGARLQSLSSVRLALSMVLCAARLLLLGVLTCCGTMFLVATLDAPELLLRALAARAVLEVGELVMSAAAPPPFAKERQRSTPHCSARAGMTDQKEVNNCLPRQPEGTSRRTERRQVTKPRATIPGWVSSQRP